MRCWVTSQKFPANNFKWIDNISRFDESFIKYYNQESDERYFLKVIAQYTKNLHKLHNDLTFWVKPEKMKIGKVKKLVVKLFDKEDHVIHLRNLKQALDHGLVLKKVLWVIKFNQKLWLKHYIGMNIVPKKTKNWLWKNCF